MYLVIKALKRLYRSIKSRVSKKPTYPQITGVGESRLKVRGRNRRALVSYLSHPFRLDLNSPEFYRHENRWHALAIAETLNEIGYVVDVIDFRDTRFIPKRRYDLFIGHGGINTEQIMRKLGESTIKVYFATGSYWKHFNAEAQARATAFNQRHGTSLAPDRLIEYSEEYACRHADGIITIGNAYLASTYSDFPLVVPVHNSCPPDGHFDQVSKDYERARGHFLFFAGHGPLHKGLDLSIEAFAKQKQSHLYVCIPEMESSPIWEVYRQLLAESGNIHLIGWVNRRSSEFYRLIDRCAFAILPSCTEAAAGSVIVGMNQGLIPVVSRATGIDTKHFGITLEDCSVDQVCRVVKDLAQRPAEWCKQKSRAARLEAQTFFSRDRFRQRFREAVLQIVEQPYRL